MLTSWKENNTLYSNLYQDIYCSTFGGLEEKKHTFINANKLSEKFQSEKNLTIFEFGFGTGLNFLLTWKEFIDNSDNSEKILNYVAIEKYPLSKEIISQTLKDFDELKEISNEFLNYYSPLENGFHRFFFSHNKIRLTLLVGDVIDCINLFDGKIDVWYLDGFSPKKNPEMWSENVFQFMANQSRENASFSTYSCSSIIKDGLQKAGFSIYKDKGIGQKKEILKGNFTQKVLQENLPTKKSNHFSRKQKPWFHINPSSSNQNSVAIIGGGLAGTSVANSLGRRGWKVTLIEKDSNLATKGSGNPAGIFCPRITLEPTSFSKLTLNGFHLLLRHLKRLKENGIEVSHSLCGGVELGKSENERNGFQKALLNSNVFESTGKLVNFNDIINIQNTNLSSLNGIHFPESGWVSPVSLCEGNLKEIQNNIEVKFNIEIVDIVKKESSWILFDKNKNQIGSWNTVVFCNSIDSIQIPILNFLPLKKNKGQIFSIPNKITNLESIVNHDGYFIPNFNNSNIVGATYELTNFDENYYPDKNTELYNKLKKVMTDLPRLDLTKMNGRIGFRCVTNDQLPVIGQIPEYQSYLNDYSEIWRGHPWDKYPLGKMQTGLYVSTALGSRGILYSLLGAELISSMICNEPLPLEKDLVESIHPARFIIRDFLKRKFICAK